MHVINPGFKWPDYVFSPDYQLLPLPEVARYIQANHHLPDVPSAEQVAQEGLELASMNAMLLRKVEELTLHLIELEAQNRALAERMQKLEAGN